MQDLTSTLGEGQDGELVWVKPKWSRLQFELRSGETTAANLAWKGGSCAVALWGESQYRFSRQGWLRPRILVRAADSNDGAEPIATFLPRSGVLTLPDGRMFTWKKPRTLTGERIWVDNAGAELARFHPARLSTAVVTTATGAAHKSELPLLILLGQYLIVLAGQDAEAAAAAATVAVIAST